MTKQEKLRILADAAIHLLMLLALVLVAMGSGCAKQASQNKVDSEFQPIVDKFSSDAAANGKDIKADYINIQFGDVSQCHANLSGEQVWGCCIRSGDPTIIIDQEAWNNFDQSDANLSQPIGSSKEALLYHELGHCVLNRSHDLDKWNSESVYGEVINSIMYPEINPILYNEFHQHYLEELFK